MSVYVKLTINMMKMNVNHTDCHLMRCSCVVVVLANSMNKSCPLWLCVQSAG